MDAAVPTKLTKRISRRWSAGAYAAFFVLFLLPFATLYAACTGERIETENGYQTLAPHTYTYQAADGTAKSVTIGSDGFTWIVIALVAVGIVISLIGLRTAFMSATSVAAVVALFLSNLAAGGSRASSKAEIGFWLSAAAIAVAPAVEVRPWRRAALVLVLTLVAIAAVIGALIGLIALTARGSG